MRQPSGPAGSSVIDAAMAVVDLGLRACAAYQRSDLTQRLATARNTLTTPGIHVVVVGEYKQGKSSLVNALLGAPVCPVDDDIATALPIYVRHGEKPEAHLLRDGTPPTRQQIPIGQLRRHVLEGRTRTGVAAARIPSAEGAEGQGGGDPTTSPPAGDVTGVEVRLPRTMLAGGLVIVDTPGLGGLRSAHAAVTLTAISTADAVLFVTDASQELTATEVEFLSRAKELCDSVVCVLTKTDFYPHWRRIRDLNAAHLKARVPDVPLMAVSSALRDQAVKLNDAELNTESGFSELVSFVNQRVTGSGLDRAAASAAGEVIAVSDQLRLQFESERAALTDPTTAQALIEELGRTKERAESLKTAAAKWQQTLSDGIADLTSDVDHDLRSRIRQVIKEADDALEDEDPADAWPQLEAWLETRTSYELVANYKFLRDQATKLSGLVGDHFREASGAVIDRIEVLDPTSLVDRTDFDHKVRLEKMTVGKQTMVALRSSYTGLIMFTMLGSLAHVALGPLAVGVGLVMGHKGLKEEKRRQLQQRQASARNAIRRYCDEVSFVVSKDSRDTLRRIQRQLRDHYGARAEELNRSTAAALRSASESVQRTEAERTKRLRDVEAELARLRTLRERAAAVAK